MRQMIDARFAPGTIGLFLALIVTVGVYWAGLHGAYVFDDFPNIVNNEALHLDRVSTADLSRAALSSPASEFKRPLASLSFALNHLATGLDPFWMKLTNLVIHLINGVLVFLLSARLLRLSGRPDPGRIGATAALIAAAWMLLPINLTAVLYVVQRMESLAHLFVLLGLLGYLAGRQRMRSGRPGFLFCIASLTVPTALGALVKEPAVMLPFYAFCMDGLLFGFQTGNNRDKRVLALFSVVLFLPLAIGLAWLLPSVLNPATWAARDFTLKTRLLSEARIIAGYIPWTLLSNPEWLSFYHDDFEPSQGLLSPATTLGGALFLAALTLLAWIVRKRAPLASLGWAFYLGGHLLTGTILPLDLAYEHRNYFPSFGLLLIAIPLLAVPRASTFALSRHAVLAAFLLASASITALTAHSWGEPLRLAKELAARNPTSPRAQYELGFTYIVYSKYQPNSPYIALARDQLQAAAELPRASILPEQALIMLSAKTGLPQMEAWWDQMIFKLGRKKPSVDDVGALLSLARCSPEPDCSLPRHQMLGAFLAALDHPQPSPRLLGGYATFAWNTLGDPALAQAMAEAAVEAAPKEPAHRITLVQILLAAQRTEAARSALQELEALNSGGRLAPEIASLAARLGEMERANASQ